MKTIDARKKCFLKRMLSRRALSRLAKALVCASKGSVAAGDGILYGLPGVFSLRLDYRGEHVRLIKEANEFRMMEKSEKSEVLLSIEVMDAAALADLYFHNATWQKVYAEGRMTFAGKTKYATLVMRIMAEGDKACLAPKKIRELYGE